MRIAVFSAKGIGSFYGALLARRGESLGIPTPAHRFLHHPRLTLDRQTRAAGD